MIISSSVVQRLSRLLLAALICLLIGGSVAAAPQQENLPEIVVENGTVMLPVIYGNEQVGVERPQVHTLIEVSRH